MRQIIILFTLLGMVVGSLLTFAYIYAIPGDTAPSSIQTHIDALADLEANAETPERAEAFRRMRESAERHAHSFNTPRETHPHHSGVIGAIYVDQVTGAPGDGNAALRTALQLSLGDSGIEVGAYQKPCTLSVNGQVDVTPSGGKDAVSIIWTVLAPDGSSPGKITQQNSVPTGSLDEDWGVNAEYAAKGAISGLLDVIEYADYRCP